MKVLIKKFDEKAVVPFKKEGLQDNFCYDCVAVSEEEIHPNVWKYSLGFGLQPTNEFDGYNIRGFNIRARSSICETGMILANSEGTVDENFTGPVSVVFYHVIPSLPRYKVGDKICQVCIEKTESMEFIEVPELRKTARGAGSYGSSGK